MLRLVIGPMWSGKTFHCIRLARRYRAIDMKVLFVDHTLDNRYSCTHVVSHDGDKEDCIFLDNLSMLADNELFRSAQVVIIEEAQFFPDLYEFVVKHVDNGGKQFIVSGLSGDYERKGIGQILQLVPHAEHIDKLNGLCGECKNGTPGSFSKRLTTTEKGQVLVGGGDHYGCVCRKHFLREE